jgi:hypothetical protein
MQYRLYNKKIFSSDLFHTDSDIIYIANYTVIIDEYISDFFFGKHFGRLVIDSFVLQNDAFIISLIFFDMLSKKYTCDCADIVITSLNCQYYAYRLNGNEIQLGIYLRYVTNNLIPDIFMADKIIVTKTPVTYTLYDFVVNVIKHCSVRKLYVDAPIPQYLCDDFMIKLIQYAVPKVKINLSDTSTITRSINTTFNEINIMSDPISDNLEYYTRCSNLTKLCLIHNKKIRENFNTYQIVSQITRANVIEDLAISIGLIKRYPNILELFTDIKILRITIYKGYRIDLLQHIFDAINVMTLDKLIIIDLFYCLNENNHNIYINFIKHVTCPVIKILRIDSKYCTISLDNICSVLENLSIKKIYVDLFSIDKYKCLIYPIFDHIVEMHYNITYNVQGSTRNIIAFLRKCLTRDSVILRITINSVSVTDMRYGNNNDCTYLTKLIERNLNLQLNRLYSVTKAIMPSA